MLEGVYWPNVGWVVMALIVLVFLACAFRRQWTIGALLIGLLHLPIALVNSVAPFRGALDPNYPGYIQGLVHADKGVEVAIFAFAMLVGGLLSACLLVLNRSGARNYFVAAFDALLLLTMAPASLGALAERGFGGFNVGFGEYLQFGGLPAFLFEFAVLVAPPAIGLWWALRRARDEQ